MSSEREDAMKHHAEGGAADAASMREQERLEELLMQRATGMLSAPEVAALDTALAAMPRGEAARWEVMASELAAVLAMDGDQAGDVAPLPAWVEERVIANGEAMVRVERGERRRARPSVTGSMTSTAPRRTGLRTAAAWGGWLAAAAALVLLLQDRASTSRTTGASAAVTAAPVAAQAQGAQSPEARFRDSLLVADSTVVRVAWKATADSAAIGAGGDIVWSSTRQAGVMRITGLASNDRRRVQYQLWIFDKSRDQRYPVDGGVFDIAPGATESFVRIDPRVPVGEAVMFAITVEPPGGVVVSTRERIALLAEASL